ncbi:MAG TPA: hypothetical protein PKY96_03015, partial [Flavobacteriales bacterium]|nr:hypothetical protein [Flavobacteriales bacterium]
FHLYPRLMANLGLSLGVPVLQMAWVNLIAVLLIYFAVWRYTWTRFPAPPMARLFAVLTITSVPLGNELWMNQTNVQWPMSLLIVLILLGKAPMHAWQRWADGSLLLLTSLTGPYVLILLPLALWHTWRKWNAHGADSSRLKFNMAILLIAGIAIAFSLAGHGTVQRTDGEFAPLNPGFVQAAFFQLWYPLIGKGVHAVPLWLGIALLTLALGAIILLWRSCRAHAFARILLVAAALQFAAVLVSYRGLPEFLSPYYAGIRNFYLPVVMIAWAMLSRQNWENKRTTAFASAMLLWWAAQTVLFVGPQRFRDQPAEVDLTPLTQGETVEVPIDPAPWVMRLEPKR